MPVRLESADGDSLDGNQVDNGSIGDYSANELLTIFNVDDMLIIRNVDDVLIILRSVSALFAWGWSVSSGVGSPLLFTIGVVPSTSSYQNASSSPSSLFSIIRS